jgi:hypothetical protein
MKMLQDEAVKDSDAIYGVFTANIKISARNAHVNGFLELMLIFYSKYSFFTYATPLGSNSAKICKFSGIALQNMSVDIFRRIRYNCIPKHGFSPLKIKGM